MSRIEKEWNKLTDSQKAPFYAAARDVIEEWGYPEEEYEEIAIGCFRLRRNEDLHRDIISILYVVCWATIIVCTIIKALRN